MSARLLPTGTVTFLFTDVQGSTRLWEEEREFMRVALPRHDAMAEEIANRHGGMVVRSRGEGDSLFMVFTSASGAINTALDFQREICQTEWSPTNKLVVRMGLHTGEVDLRDGDYYGSAVNRAARIRALAHGGQILISDVARALAAEQMPEGSSILDLGEHRLRDLAQIERVYQLVHPDLPKDFPPIRSLSNQPNNLPQQVTSFIGREKEITEVSKLLKSNKLVTLLGTGGTGKTRLSLQLAADNSDGFKDGVWFAELAPLSDPKLVANTVADIFGLKEQPGLTSTANVVEALRDKNLLLVLDNCEHLVDPSAKFADQILRNCSGIVILVTSREALNIPGEAIYRVPSLALPDPKKKQTPKSLSHFAAVQLFIDRAEKALSTFVVTNENAPALASLCYQLDGIPLAIELAAARVRSLSVEEIDRKLDQRFRLLTGGSRTAMPRQQTLRSLVDWSYDLLSEPEKLLLQRLSVFSGGWVLEATESICADDVVEEWELLDLLTSLCDKSLVVFEQSAGSTRYRLLETVRQYSRDRLLESGDVATWRQRHLAYFEALGEEARPHLRGASQKEWLIRLESEHDNLRAALTWSFEEPSSRASGLRLAAALWRFWCLRGHFSEGRQWIERALACDPGTEPDVRARALNGAGNLAELQMDAEDARSKHMESLGISQGLNDRWSAAMSLNNLGNTYGNTGEIDIAAQYWGRALEIWRDLERQGTIGDLRGFAATLDNLGNIAFNKGDSATAKTYYEECLAIRRQLGNIYGVACSLLNIGTLAHSLGNHSEAWGEFRECLADFNELEDPLGIAYSLEGLAWPREPLFAAQLLGAAERIRGEIGSPHPASEQREMQKRVAQVRAQLQDDSAFDQAWSEGRAMTTQQAVDLALRFEGNDG